MVVPAHALDVRIVASNVPKARMEVVHDDVDLEEGPPKRLVAVGVASEVL